MTLSVGVYLLGQPGLMVLLQTRSIRLRWRNSLARRAKLNCTFMSAVLGALIEFTRVMLPNLYV